MSAPTDETAADPWDAFAALPGNPLIWVLILSEFAVFALFFGGFSIARLLDPETFAAGQQSLNPWVGTANTIALLTSGWCVARACRDAGCARVASLRRWLSGASVLGGAFIALKLTEYGAAIGAGHGLTTDTFFTLYFLVTGFHLLHVVAGVVALALVARWPNPAYMETAASFWHMVDIVWLVLFPLIYLLR